MFRSSCSASFRVFRGVRGLHDSGRSSSSTGIKVLGVGVLGAGGVLGYAMLDPDFRKEVEKYIPLLGETKPPAVSVTPPSKLKVTKIPASEVKTLPPSLPPTTTATTIKSEPTSESSQKPSTLLFEKRFKSFESLLKDVKSAASASNQATLTHTSLLKQIMESGDSEERDENAWNEVFNAANNKREAVKKINELMGRSNLAVKELIDLVEEEKEQLLKKGILTKAENDIKTAVSDLKMINDDVIKIRGEAKVVDEFRDLVENGKRAIQQEIAAILPPGGPESKEDMDIFVQHAYKKILYLQQELARHKTIDKQKYAKAVEELRVERNMETQNSLQGALDSQRMEHEWEIEKAKQAVAEKMEAELRTQLKRQAAAHFDHLNDTRDIQEKEISRRYDRLMHEVILKEVNSKKAEMAKISGAYEGLIQALEKRGDADIKIVKAQNLWIAATALFQSAIVGKSPLRPAVNGLKEHLPSEEDHKFVSTVFANLDSEVLDFGTPTEEEIRERFVKVQRLAHRTAMIGDEETSPFVYFLSYLQSKFVRSPECLSAADIKEIDLETINTFDITSLARSSLDGGNLEQAAKYMTLLKGEPLRIAKDWIADVRRILEIRQACEAVVAYIASVGIQYPQNK